MVDDVGRETSQEILGRSRELDRLDEMVERLAAGRGSVVVLIGPPGIGLTTLLEEAISRAGVVVDELRAVHVPSGLLEADASGALALVASLTADDVFRRDAEAVLGTVADAGGSVAPDDPRLVQVAVSALRTLSKAKPLLITIDNLPVEGGSAFNGLASLAAGLADQPVLVVATSHVLPRSSFEESPVGPLWVRRVPPLPTNSAVALLRRTAARRLPHSVAAMIAHQTGGNPGDLVAVGKLLEPDRLSGREPLPELLPSTAVSSAMYRPWWDALDPRARQFLLGASGPVPIHRSTLEECAGITLADVAGPEGDPALGEENGRVVSRDSRLLSAVRALAPPRELRDALAALATRSPEGSLERYWLSLSSGEAMGAERLDALLDGAHALLDRGEPAAAQRLVHDIMQRLAGRATLPTDLLVRGGLAAMYCGHPARAVSLLTTALTDSPGELGRIGPLLLIAATHSELGVPHRLAASCIGRLATGEPRAAASLAALAARLCAEYGEEGRGGQYFDQAQTLLASDPADGDMGVIEDAITRAMVERQPIATRSVDPLAVLGIKRAGDDIAGWLLELQGLGQLIESGDWTQARAEISSLRARFQRFPAPLLRAQLALASIKLHLAACEYRRADELAAAAVAQMLPLHVPQGGAGIALLAQVALVRGRAAEADSWLADVEELTQGSPGTPVLAVAYNEALGLRALLADDLDAAREHYTRAVREGSVLPSTRLELARLRWRAGAGDGEDLAGLVHAGGDDVVFNAAAALLRASVHGLVDTVATVTSGVRESVPSPHEAQLLELAADRVGALTVEQGGVAPATGSVRSGQLEYRLSLLQRAKELYTRAGASGHAAAAGREIGRLGPAPMSDQVDFSSLTTDELTIAQLVHGGATNKEVASTLYVSVRTVELRLTSVYRKLGISSRRELRQLASLSTAGNT